MFYMFVFLTLKVRKQDSFVLGHNFRSLCPSNSTLAYACNGFVLWYLITRQVYILHPSHHGLTETKCEDQFNELKNNEFNKSNQLVIEESKTVLSWCTRLHSTIDNIGLFHGLKSCILVTQFPRYDSQKLQDCQIVFKPM